MSRASQIDHVHALNAGLSRGRLFAHSPACGTGAAASSACRGNAPPALSQHPPGHCQHRLRGSRTTHHTPGGSSAPHPPQWCSGTPLSAPGWTLTGRLLPLGLTETAGSRWKLKGRCVLQVGKEDEGAAYSKTSNLKTSCAPALRQYI